MHFEAKHFSRLMQNSSAADASGFKCRRLHSDRPTETASLNRKVIRLNQSSYSARSITTCVISPRMLQAHTLYISSLEQQIRSRTQSFEILQDSAAMRRNTFGFTYITFTCKYLLRCLRGGRRCQTCDGVIIAPRLTWPTHDGALFPVDH